MPGTRQSLKYTRQRLCRVPHSAKDTRQKINRQRAFVECFLSGNRQSLCRVPEKHSAKIYTRQNENAKNPKIIAIFFSGEAATGQRPPASIKVAAFFAQNSRLTRPVGFELTTSPSRVCCSTTTLHCHLCLRFRYLSSYIILN